MKHIIACISFSTLYQPALLSASVVEPEPEPRAEEPKLNCLPEQELKLRIVAPAPFYLLQKFYRKKIITSEKVIGIFLLQKLKKGYFQGIL